jgi:hypothetical protein
MAVPTVTSALNAAQDQDEVHIRSATTSMRTLLRLKKISPSGMFFVTATFTSLTVVYSRPTIRADDGVIVSPNKRYVGTIAMWTFVNSKMTLKGHFTLLLQSYPGFLGRSFCTPLQ